MITLYTFGPFFGQPDASPFVIKAMLLLKMAGLDYKARPDRALQGAEGQAALSSTTTARKSRIPPSSASTSKRNTASITTPG